MRACEPQRDSASYHMPRPRPRPRAHFVRLFSLLTTTPIIYPHVSRLSTVLSALPCDPSSLVSCDLKPRLERADFLQSHACMHACTRHRKGVEKTCTHEKGERKRLRRKIKKRRTGCMQWRKLAMNSSIFHGKRGSSLVGMLKLKGFFRTKEFLNNNIRILQELV
jgi:hypothetical protein